MGITEAAAEYVSTLFQNNSGGHDAAHTMRVYHNAVAIAKEEPACDMEIVSLAALLHDADDHKLFRTENNANARSFLESQGVSAEKTEQICRAINSVSFSQNRGKRPDTAEGKIVQDADRLDAIGAVGIARTFAFGGEHGRSLESSIQHFHEKLLLLKDEMNTETARKIAEERHTFMVAFLKEFASETKQSGGNENET
ncbi:MAG: HD domain-containing protein [Anaerolineaceae bacterium]|nr:HD domain-containing protein [Oscillospiraceae bacterium]MBQ6479780.1 HD domain-containing protein [Anaerolineaceae bacterium]